MQAGYCSTNRRIVPPHPISMSSEWDPRHRIVRGPSALVSTFSRIISALMPLQDDWNWRFRGDSRPSTLQSDDLSPPGTARVHSTPARGSVISKSKIHGLRTPTYPSPRQERRTSMGPIIVRDQVVLTL